jgi:hypothetical protein
MSQTELQEETNNFENKLFNKTEPKKFIRKKKINIIEFEKNPNQENKINSPRSKEAITNLGYIFEELIYLDYNKFKQEHPEIIPLDPEIQQKRYIFFENQRKNKIEEIKELYERICIDEKKRNKNYFSRTMVNNYLDKKNNENEEITFIKNKELETMKSKSEIEFINMINYEIKREIMEEESKRKLRLQNEKRELIKQEIIKKREIELKNKLQREKERKEKEEEERERIKLKEKEKYEEEIKKRKEEEEKEKKK